MSFSSITRGIAQIAAVGCVSIFTISGAAVAQSATEAKFVMQDIEKWLPGMFDNEPQTYLEAAFGVSDDGPHTRSYINIEKLVTAETSEVVEYQLSFHDGGRHQATSKQVIWSFAMADAAIAMKQRRVGAEEGDDTASCQLLWRRGQNEVYAEANNPAECGIDASADIRLSKDGLWILNHNLVGARTDGIHNKYMKASELECFVYAMHDKSKMKDGDDDRTVINPFYMHNRGDTFTFSTKESEPQTFTLYLRNSMWASRSGRNFVPLLSLALHEGPNTSGAIKGNAWAAGSSDRVGFDAGGTVGARCKHYIERRPSAVQQ